MLLGIDFFFFLFEPSLSLTTSFSFLGISFIVEVASAYP